MEPLVPHIHPENPTTKDVYDLVDRWGERHREAMNTLEEATNHKVDYLRTQVWRVLGIFAVVSVPVVINNWGILVRQIQETIF